MSYWPSDGLWRVTSQPGVDGIQVIPVGGETGTYYQPVPQSLLSSTPFNLLSFYVSAITATGNTAVWTPTAGTRFNLLGWRIDVSGNASRAAGSSHQFQLRDGATTPIAGITVFIPGAAGTVMGNDVSSGWNLYGTPMRSTAVNNVLNLNNAAVLATGQASVLVVGFETTF
jgi:hypothetical protein